MSRVAGERLTSREHVREFFCRDLTPLAIYDRLSEGSSYRFLFESVTGGDQVSRYSFVGASPAAVYRLFRDRLEVEAADGRRLVIRERPLAALAEELARIRSPRPTLPFAGGFVGYFGYDLARLSEPLGPPPADDPYALPLAELGRYDTVVVFDHARQRLAAVSNEIDGLVSPETARRRLDELTVSLLEVREIRGAAEVPGDSDPSVPEMDAVVSADDYSAAVESLKEHIRAGDILQAVLARRWTVEADLEPAALYRAVRLINPSPYMVLLDSPAVALIGASPEMLVRKQGARLETRP
ncbi:MAG: chorismate-binding protein, partial [Thermoanaerobaculia bacterium]|nr:chorismate-binding protein [Thermoanaerobaculia bacterium]